MSASIEFVPSSLLNELDPEERTNFIVEKVKGSSILILEMELNPEERLLLMKKALEHYDTDFIGIQLKEISIKLKANGLLRKQNNATLLLVAPGNAEIHHKDHGILSVSLLQ